MKLKELLESFYKGLKVPDYSGNVEYVEIFKNPSPKEFRDAAGEWSTVRFLANIPSKTLFIFAAGVTHEMLGEIEGNISELEHPSVSGEASKVGGKWVIDIEDLDNSDEQDEIREYKDKLDWLSRYNMVIK